MPKVLPTLPPFPSFPPCIPLRCLNTPTPTPTQPTPTPTHTPTPTPSPSASPDVTKTPTPTPFGYVDYLDGRDNGPSFVYSKTNYACFGHNRLPTSIGPITVGPVSKSDPSIGCYKFPVGGTQTISVSRVSFCDWQTGNFAWVSDAFEYPITIYAFTNKVFQENPNLNNVNDVFHFSGDGDAQNTGSCSYDPVTGAVTLTMTGIAEFEGQGGGVCYLPYTVNYVG